MSIRVCLEIQNKEERINAAACSCRVLIYYTVNLHGPVPSRLHVRESKRGCVGCRGYEPACVVLQTQQVCFLEALTYS